jgi:hypothetical protein
MDAAASVEGVYTQRCVATAGFLYYYPFVSSRAATIPAGPFAAAA